MQVSAIASHETSLDMRMTASSVSILAARVATAAARLRDGGELLDRDRAAVSAFERQLQNEVKILRGETSPNDLDEESYAFADVTLSTLGGASKRRFVGTEAAQQLSEMVATLQSLRKGTKPSHTDLDTVERFFLEASAVASQESGSFSSTWDSASEENLLA